MKINRKFLTPPRVIFTLFLTLSLLTGCMTEADSGSNEDDGQVTNPTENTSISYTITFCSNGGDGGTSPADITAKSGEEVTLPACTFTRTGYDFKGWCRFTDGTGTIYEAGEKVKDLNEGNGDVTLFAKWVLVGNWSISYVLNGDALTPAQNSSENPTEYNIETEKVTLYAPKRRFYEFAGWYDNADFSDYEWDGWSAGVVTGDVKLYAKWTVTCNSITAAIEAGATEIKLAGKISEDEIGAIAVAVREKSDTKLTVDLGETTGLTKIPNDSFSECSNLTSISIPQGITVIGASAFYNCTGLEIVSLPDGLEKLDTAAFSYCTSLKEITLPSSVSSIGGNAFLMCKSLESIVIPEKVTVLQLMTFVSCDSLAEITIPVSVTHIESSVFSSYKTSSVIKYGGTMEQWNKITKENFNEKLDCATIYCTDGTIHPNAAIVIKYLYEGSHTVPVIGDVSAEYLEEIANAIRDNYMAEITLDMSNATGLTEIPEKTFYDCFSLFGIVLPADIKTIGNSAFEKCQNLNTVNYVGTTEQWSQVSIGSQNDPLNNVVCLGDRR